MLQFGSGGGVKCTNLLRTGNYHIGNRAAGFVFHAAITRKKRVRLLLMHSHSAAAVKAARAAMQPWAPSFIIYMRPPPRACALAAYILLLAFLILLYILIKNIPTGCTECVHRRKVNFQGRASKPLETNKSPMVQGETMNRKIHTARKKWSHKQSYQLKIIGINKSIYFKAIF